MVHTIDNRNGKADLKIHEDGYGNWYAWNDEIDKYIACKYRYEAAGQKHSLENWDIGFENEKFRAL